MLARMFCRIGLAATCGRLAAIIWLRVVKIGAPAVAGATAVLFPVPIGAPPAELAYTAPTGTTRHLITGLDPDTAYAVTVLHDDGAQSVQIRPGDGLITDSGGVLAVTLTR